MSLIKKMMEYAEKMDESHELYYFFLPIGANEMAQLGDGSALLVFIQAMQNLDAYCPEEYELAEVLAAALVTFYAQTIMMIMGEKIATISAYVHRFTDTKSEPQYKNKHAEALKQYLKKQLKKQNNQTISDRLANTMKQLNEEMREIFRQLNENDTALSIAKKITNLVLKHIKEDFTLDEIATIIVAPARSITITYKEQKLATTMMLFTKEPVTNIPS